MNNQMYNKYQKGKKSDIIQCKFGFQNPAVENMKTDKSKICQNGFDKDKDRYIHKNDDYFDRIQMDTI